MRKTIGIDDRETPIEPRVFRNHFEHFDERLESWFSSSDRHNIADANIMPTSAIKGIDPDDFLRNYDPSTATITFRGDEYPVHPIIDALTSLSSKVRPVAAKPHWID